MKIGPLIFGALFRSLCSDSEVVPEHHSRTPGQLLEESSFLFGMDFELTM